MSEFYVILTNTGKAKITNAHATQTPVNLIEMAVGDGNGAYYEPTENQTKLINEVHRGGINEIYVDEVNLNWLICNFVITADVGGFTVREVGLFDEDGDLIAIGKYPESYKPALESGSAKDLMIKMIIEVTNTEDVTLNIDPSIILASRDFVTKSIEENNQNYYTKVQVDTSLNQKSDKGHGHTLSDIAETDTEKKLTSAEREKILNIAEGANKYVHPDSHSINMVDDSSSFVKMTPAERTKLSGVTTGANKYVHPVKHASSIITDSSSRRFTSDSEKAIWNAKSNLTLGEGLSNAYRGDRGKKAYDHSNVHHLALGSASSQAYRGDRGTIAYNHANDASKHYNLIANIRVYSASATYSRPSNLAFMILEIVAGGGGGGGCPPASQPTSCSASSGGGGGGFARRVFLYSELSSSTSLIIGAGGAGGAAASLTGGNGHDGGDSSFNTTKCFGGKGGNGGVDMQAYASNYHDTAPALGGAATTADFVQYGGYSTAAIIFYGRVMQGSLGGDSYFSRMMFTNGLGLYSSGNVGYRGGGGGGMANHGNTSGYVGTTGGNGYCMITEYLNV